MSERSEERGIFVEVVNSQWLHRESAEVVNQTPKTITVRAATGVMRFWKDSGLMIGHSKLRGRGEPYRLIDL